MHRTLVSFGPGFLKVAVLAWLAVLNGCAQLTSEVVVRDSGGGYVCLQPLVAVSESANRIHVTRICQEPTGELRVSVPAGTQHVLLVHASDSDTLWARIETTPDARVAGDAVMVPRPLAAILQELSDEKLRQLLDGVLAIGDEEPLLEAILAEIGRRGGAAWLWDLHRVLREGRKELAATTVIRRIEGKPAPLKIVVEVALIEDVQCVVLRLTNQDDLHTFPIPELSFVMPWIKLRNGSGEVVFDRDRRASEPAWGVISILITICDLAPGASKVLPVETPTRLPAGEYSADWTWHDDIGVLGWHRFDEDLVEFTGFCAVRVD